jgi:PAS domain-containing protein
MGIGARRRNLRELRNILQKTAKNLDSFKHPRVSIAWTDRDLIFRRVHNPSPDLGTDILGKKLEDVLGDTVQARRLSMAKRRVLQTGKSFHSVTKVILGGNEHTIDVSIEPTYDERGNLDGVISINIDVTDLVEARERLSEANERLVKILDTALGDGPAASPRRAKI